MSEPITVSYEGSYQRFDGGWDKLVLTLPVGATEEQIAAALATWQRMRDRGLDALKAANPPLSEANGAAVPDQGTASPDLVLTFGKHKGRSVRDVAAADLDYVEWLAREARNETVRRSARMALGRNASQTAGQDEPPYDDYDEEELPF